MSKDTRPLAPSQRGRIVVVHRMQQRSYYGMGNRATERYQLARVLKARLDGQATHFVLGKPRTEAGAGALPRQLNDLFPLGRPRRSDEWAPLGIQKVWTIPAAMEEPAAVVLGDTEYDTLDAIRTAIANINHNHNHHLNLNLRKETTMAITHGPTHYFKHPSGYDLEAAAIPGGPYAPGWYYWEGHPGKKIGELSTLAPVGPFESNDAAMAAHRAAVAETEVA